MAIIFILDVDVNEHPADCATGKTIFLDSSQPDLSKFSYCKCSMCDLMIAFRFIKNLYVISEQRRKSHYDNHVSLNEL